MNIHKFLTKLVAYLCLMVIVAPRAIAQSNQCAALIPSSGAYQLTISNGTHKSFNSAKAMYCSDDWVNSRQSSGWMFNVVVPGYGAGGAGASNTSYFSSRSSFCADNSKDFTESDKAALYRLQGDDVIARAFVDCMKITNPDTVYTVNASSTGDDATLTITPNLSQNAVERIVTVTAISGASTKDGVSIAPGTPLIGHSAVVGGYTLTAPQATFIIKTSTGDKTVSVRRCRTGTVAGLFQVKATTYSTSLTPAGRWVKDVPFGAAGCNPKCKMNSPPNADSGDMILQVISGPPNVILRNLQYQCVGGGCPFADTWDTKLLDDHQVQLAFRNRSVPILVHLQADQFTETQLGTEKVLDTGQITYGTPFSVSVPTNTSGAYLVRDHLITPLDSISNGAPYRVISAKVSAGNNYVWTLQLDDAACGP
jgi:hypothetical protein